MQFSVSPGLFYCPLPEGWVGTDHGTILYLVQPRRCPQDDVPRISLYYALNVDERERADGTDVAPRSDRELARDECRDGVVSRQPAFSLLGHSATLCTHRAAATVEIAAHAVYALEPPRRGATAPDRILIVTLDTTPAREAADLPRFRQVLSSISICTPEWARRSRGRLACPADGVWW